MKYLLNGESSERLLFRKLEQNHFNDWLPFHKDPRSSEFWDGLPTDPIVACKQQFNRAFERYQYNLGGMNALISKKTNKLIGLCGLLVQTVDDIDELEIGYSILPKYWRKGYATEAAVKCKEYAFKHNFTDSLISIIHTDNIPSQKVAIANGMHLSKTTSYCNNPVHIYRVFK
ncbi:GNAT family N-acetyltransferase [Cellulophaga lytica]|uniref:GCN5-related N-acetyltransferase n=1 Tax=Cellulophaga lytica (strain ATCC 23178 / DSM 7489 / JCM 8516 / NBRC 14961 / NCIMB 1423 / VKM B-1433 / Cy l20) TaxID=867900 RepID=F0RGC6_CELLC|nr:GNAT family N-acetyltransferase [Cellulophaga lytica]ADY30117.1 GCN5-related N-acetyltransferase [Cellulophaga lytica DSM 7489]AIM61111.1 GNAT family acetyltransferase [Cellulophaga lytica]WQG75721.1 GNAT family N-acetyltransferase [Cellulophaga lytica]SNQ42399.1 GCN5-related N-acetyltransferase [Cellulophaga lytica]